MPGHAWHDRERGLVEAYLRPLGPDDLHYRIRSLRIISVDSRTWATSAGKKIVSRLAPSEWFLRNGRGPLVVGGSLEQDKKKGEG